MKNLIYFLLIFTSNFAKGQDLWVQSVNYTPHVLQVNSSAELSTYFAITDVIAPAGCVGISIDLPPNITLSNGISSVSGGSASTLFDWHLNGGDLIGISNVDIFDGGGEIRVNVVGAIATISSATIVTLLETGACGPFSDIEDTENQLIQYFEVQAPAPIKISSFDITSTDCKNIELNWVTSSEINNDYIEIQRSSDGKKFDAIGKVNGLNNPRGGSYSYTDDENLVYGARYYYRLKQVDFDGKSEVHKIASEVFKCDRLAADLVLYPNPAHNSISIAFLGETNDISARAIIVNSTGETVKTLKLIPGKNDVDISALSSGVYTINTVDLPSQISKRFIKID